MLLSELRDLIDERLVDCEDGDVTICVGTIVHGQSIQIITDVNELAEKIHPTGETEFVLLNEELD